MIRRFKKEFHIIIGQICDTLSGETRIAGQITRGVSGTAFLKLFNAGATFLTAIVLARVLGVKEYGIYAYAISWVTLLGVFAKAGIDQVMVRNIAVFHQRNDWSRIRGMFRFGILLVITASLLCSVVAVGVAWLFHRDDPEILRDLWLACLLLPLQAVASPFGAVLQGFGQIVYAQLPSLFVTPLVFLALVTGTYVLAPAMLFANQVILIRIAVVLASLLIAALFLRAGMARSGRPPALPRPVCDSREWLASAVPLVLMGSMFMVNANADILMLGSMVGPEAAGIYKVVTRGAELVAFSLTVINVPLAPLIARLHAAGDRGGLQSALTKAVILSFAPAAVIGLIFMVKGDLLLKLFGADFLTGEAASALSILVLGQLVNVACGSVGILLVMAKHEVRAAWGLAISAALNVVLNAILIPRAGVAGAATATAVSMGAWNVVLVWFVVQRLKLNPTILPTFIFQFSKGVGHE